MQQAYKLDENSIYLAWSGMIRVIQVMELLETDAEGLREEAIACTSALSDPASLAVWLKAIASRFKFTMFLLRFSP